VEEAQVCDSYNVCESVITGENYVRLDDEFFCCDCAVRILQETAQDAFFLLEARNAQTIIRVLQHVNDDALARTLKLVTFAH
jgi:hypothetical protein